MTLGKSFDRQPALLDRESADELIARFRSHRGVTRASTLLIDDPGSHQPGEQVRLKPAHPDRIEIALEEVQTCELSPSAIAHGEPSGPAGLGTCPELVIDPAGIHG